MSVNLLDINDAGLTIFGGPENTFVSPGFACDDVNAALYGTEGEARVKLQPTNTEYHFWDRLSMDALEQPSRLGHSFADLAYGHLESIAAELGGMPQLLVAVPADLDRSPRSFESPRIDRPSATHVSGDSVASAIVGAISMLNTGASDTSAWV